MRLDSTPFFWHNAARMDIQWHGLSCFTIKGKSATVVTDPYDASVAGIKPPELTADIEIANAESRLHRGLSQTSVETKIFDWPGEYEAKNVIIQGISAYDRPRDKDEEGPKKEVAGRVIIYTMEIDGFKICHLSNIGHKLTSEMLEAIGDVDILLIPVGGNCCLDAKKAHEVVEQIDPRVVIPMYYKIPGVKLSLSDLEVFLKEVGLHVPSREKVLKFQNPENLPQEHTEYKILEPVLG